MQTTTTAIAALLTQAGGAHYEYEQTVLKGVYDEEWASWYADYVIQHGLGKLLNQAVTTEQISQFFNQSYEEYKKEHSVQNWADYTALENGRKFSAKGEITSLGIRAIALLFIRQIQKEQWQI